ncbi:MAG TPA: HPr family phosphocarrier protein [Lachnospiraceae bacterium]|nr:HPr family phosphocarrier protein [Lachnospiraceae bacterium]HPF28623.1 HPr family phosphocarrier protein [Lachnospiraceae bacterium]
MKERTVTVQINDGLDAGTIAVLVQRSCKYTSSVYLQTEGKKVNAKSIMGMMNIGVSRGGEITIIVDGEDEDQAMEEIAEFIENAK